MAISKKIPSMSSHVTTSANQQQHCQAIYPGKPHKLLPNPPKGCNLLLANPP
jgi:hypothetical protein